MEFIRKAWKIVHEQLYVHLEIFSRPQAKETFRQYLLLRTDILTTLCDEVLKI